MASDNKTKNLYLLFKNYHFWIIFIITLFLVILYRSWPWRVWQQGQPSFLEKLALIEISNYIIGVLFFIPIIYATLIYTWKGALAISIVALCSVAPIISKLLITGSFITNITRLLLPLLLICIISIEVNRRRRERRHMLEREEERQAYLAKVLEAQEKERQRISHELHDDTMQTLLTIGRFAEAILSEEENDVEGTNKKATLIRDISFTAFNDLRLICLDLRPSMLDNLGLIATLRWFVDQIKNESNLDVHFTVDGTERSLAPQTELMLFRIIQEALNNVIRHSKAKNTIVRLKFSETHLEVLIKDNGIGFYYEKRMEGFSKQGKLGLIGIKQRVSLINGKFLLNSEKGKGTSISILVEC